MNSIWGPWTRRSTPAVLTSTRNFWHFGFRNKRLKKSDQITSNTGTLFNSKHTDLLQQEPRRAKTPFAPRRLIVSIWEHHGCSCLMPSPSEHLSQFLYPFYLQMLACPFRCWNPFHFWLVAFRPKPMQTSYLWSQLALRTVCAPINHLANVKSKVFSQLNWRQFYWKWRHVQTSFQRHTENVSPQSFVSTLQWK